MPALDSAVGFFGSSRSISGLRRSRSIVVPTASRPMRPAAAFAAASTMSGRRNTASSRARWAGRSSRRSVSSRMDSRAIFTSWPVTEAVRASRSTKESASSRQRPWRTSGSLSWDFPSRVSLLTPAMREALPSDGIPSSPAIATMALRRFDQNAFRSSGIPRMRVNSLLGPYCSTRTPRPSCSSQAM